MADWVRVFGVVGLWLILTAMFASVTHYFYQRLFDHRSVSVSIAKDKDRDVSAEFVARAHDLQKPMRLDRLREIHLPQLGTRFTRMETMFPAGMKFEVQGVDVTTVLRLLDSLFQRAPRRVEGQIATAEKSIQVSLTNPGRSEATTLRALTIYEKDPASELRLLDRAVLWNIYQLNYGLSPNRVRSESMNSTPAFPTAEALEAYYAGRWHLDVYQNAYSPEDLDRAESHFKTLREAMPRFRDGLLLLGVTLTEQRKEDEAIGVFEQIENDLPSPTDFRERRHLLEAQLLGAVAHRKRYKLADNHVAVQKLQYVATRANALVNDPQVAQWRVDFLRLYLEALVELCSALGHYQVLLNARNFGSELISIDAPPEIQLNPSEKQALDDADKLPAEQRVEERQKVYRVVKQRIWDSQNSKKRDAEAALDSLESLKKHILSDGS